MGEKEHRLEKREREIGRTGNGNWQRRHEKKLRGILTVNNFNWQWRQEKDDEKFSADRDDMKKRERHFNWHEKEEGNFNLQWWHEREEEKF